MAMQIDKNPINKLTFSILSPLQIEAQSVCEITDASLYERRLPRRPKTNGLCDLRMGTSDWRLKCETCGHDIIRCPGHPGHMNLCTAVYHAGFLSTTLKVLRCVCFFCSELLIDPNSTFLQADHRPDGDVIDQRDLLNMVMLASKTKQACRICNAPQPKYLRNGNSIRHEFVQNAVFENEEDQLVAAQPLTAEMVGEILEGIEDTVVNSLGLQCRPEWMVFDQAVRPAAHHQTVY